MDKYELQCKRCTKTIKTNEPDIYTFTEHDKQIFLCDDCMEEDFVNTFISKEHEVL